MKRSILATVLLMFVAAMLAACLKTDPAVTAVEEYVTALVNKDGNRLSTLSCADWESSALLELDSLQAVDTRLEGLVCSVTGTDGQNTLVTCQGKIITTYNNENQELDLSVRSYVVVQQGGDSLVCGYQ